MQGKGLLRVAGLDAVRVRLVDAFDVPLFLVEESHRARRSVLEHVEVVVLSVLSERSDLPRVAVHVHPPNHIAVHPFKGGAASVHVAVVLDLARLVVLSWKVERLGFEPQVDVFGDQNDLGLRLAGLKAQCRIQNLVVVGAFREDVGGGGVLAAIVHHNFQLASHAIVQGNPILQGVGVAQFVEDPDASARFKMLRFVADLEPVEFFKNRDGQGHLVVLEVVECGVVKQQHACVQHEDFGLDIHRLLLGRSGCRGAFLCSRLGLAAVSGLGSLWCGHEAD